ncbi:sorbitol dehydrogenase-like [Sitophilus oryzae]|uniref:Sorbitol dehydrogenase n=1 Tax=Sitophilus oryzae TaxID=7048 RepID=A0A6J2XMY3_SITOR|nr:sorbitol dehydrogenase-like [Sitophilus oryzae]
MALGKIQNFKYLLFGNVFNSNLSETNGKQNRNYADICKNKESSKHGENLAVVLHGINDLKIEKRPIPKLKPNQVLLQMEVVGICGSDVHFFREGRIGPFVVEKPMIIGHEGSGTVVECGPAVKTLKSGDRVAIEPQISCRMCDYCKTGNYHLCQGLYFCAAPPDDGNLSRYYAHDSDFCFKLPDNLDFEHATLMEPLAVGVHACKRGGVTSGDSVLVLGSGPIGLVSILAARAYGASKIVVTDVDDFKLKKAHEVGVDCTCNIKGLNVDEALECIKSILPEHPRVTIDCCGLEDAVKVGMKATKSGGKLVLVGMGTDKMALPITECIFREVDLLGVFRYVNDYPTAIDMVSSGKIDPKPLITHHFKFEDSVKAFETAKNKTEDYIKIMIHPNPKWKPK